MSRYAIAEGVLVQKVVSDTVLLDSERGEYFELNSMGSEMLHRLERLGDPELVMAELLEEYMVSPEELRADLDGLIRGLMGAGLVELRE
jgi:hypothetical protein